MIKTILYIHQSAELYGSDKALYFLVNQINLKPEFKVIVVLPNDGPLKKLLEKSNIKVIIFPVIKVSRDFFKPRNIIGVPFKILKTTKGLHSILKNEKIDLVHSNTLAVLLGAFFAKRYKLQHIWHVHEIIRKPKIVKLAYPILVNMFSTKVVFNSKASKDFLTNNKPRLKRKSIINLNGLDRTIDALQNSEKERYKQDVFKVKEEDIVIALIGRISKWKGQSLLLNSFKHIVDNYKNLQLIFIGSAPPNQEFLVKKLQSHIDSFNLKDSCKIIPFRDDIEKIWDCIDIAVVPSIEPEPFGLVALEAMLAKKPVIGANHGGLKEIIVDGETGYLFKPNDHKDLALVLEKLISNANDRKEFGKKGFERALNYFSLKRHVNQFIDIYTYQTDKF